jgi:hypothetical protein
MDRYIYARDNPERYVDKDGHVISMRSYTDASDLQFLASPAVDPSYSKVILPDGQVGYEKNPQVTSGVSTTGSMSTRSFGITCGRGGCSGFEQQSFNAYLNQNDPYRDSSCEGTCL